MEDKKLNWEDILNEIDRVKDFFDQVPEEFKQDAAVHLAFEAAVWAADTPCHGLGILEEAKLRYREVCYEVMATDDVDEEEKDIE